MKWEYKVGMYPNDPNNLEMMLNGMGDDEWELVAINEKQIIWKRPKINIKD